jgi:hypothetical protein
MPRSPPPTTSSGRRSTWPRSRSIAPRRWMRAATSTPWAGWPTR